MKKISLAAVISLVVCTTTVFAKDSPASEKNNNPSSQPASQPEVKKKANVISKWLFQKDPSHYSESHKRGEYRVRDRK